MPVTVNLSLLKRKQRPDGKIPIYIRLTENRSSRFKSTGIYLLEKNWDPDAQRVKSNHREAKHLNIHLDRIRMEINELNLPGTLTMNQLLSALDKKADPDSRNITKVCERYREHLKASDRYWERRHFVVMVRDIKAYIDKGASDSIDDLTSSWIEGLQSYLLRINNTRTVRKKIQRLSGMVKWMVKTGQIENNPFYAVGRVKAGNGEGKTKLSIDQIRAIENLDLPEGKPIWHTRNYFLYSFYNAGVRFWDLCTLRWNNIIDGRLVYRMHKTGGHKSIEQIPASLEILQHYRKPDQKPKDFIFPILHQDIEDPMELRRVISSRNVVVNRLLKDIAASADIQATVSFHVSRHSFAHYALTKGMDLYSISKALGHSDLKITQDYIKSFDEHLLDKAMRNIFS